MSSCRKIHDPYMFEEAFNLVSKGVSCEGISIILYILSVTLRTNDRCVDLIALFHISNEWVGNVFHISLKFTHTE